MKYLSSIRFLKRLVWPLGGALLLSMFPAGEGRAQTPAAKEITIPVILPLTGSAAFLGAQQKIGLDVAQNFVNKRGSHIKLVYYDDTSSPQVAVQLVTQLTAGGSRVLIGPMVRATCAAVEPLMKNGPLDYCLSPTLHAPPGSFVFTGSTDTWDLDRAVMRFARFKGWKRIAMLTPTDASGVDAIKGFQEALKDPDNRDLTLVEQLSFNPTDTTVTAQLARIKAAKPDLLLAWATGAPIATILREMNALGLDVPVATGYSNMTYQQMDSMVGYMPKNLYFPVPSAVGSRTREVALDRKVESALKDFDAEFAGAGLKPDAGVLTTWDPILIIARACSDLGPDATSEQLRNYLSHLKGFAGINGIYDFEKYPQRGLSEINTYVTRWSPETKSWAIVSKAAGVPFDSAKTR
jgi:branched-chain amino acid transport system substrate-binding protein